MSEREKEPQTKTYKEMSTGRVETAVVGSDVEKALIEQGYVEIDPETGEVKDKGAAAKAEVNAMPKPLNPDAKVHTEADIEAAKAAKEAPPAYGTAEKPAPEPPAMPKPLNEPKEPPAPAVPKKPN